MSWKNFIPVLILIITSCSGDDNKGKLLASVNDAELYEIELKSYLKEQDYNPEDSADLASDFVDQWVKDQILVQEAQNNENVDNDKVEHKVEAFRNDLYILELEQELVNERLDTNITDEEIQQYYESHPQDFQLNDYLVKVLYLKIPVDAPDIEKISYKYKLYKETDINEIELYAKIYATNYYYDENNWIYFDDLLKEIPLQDINKDRFIMKRSKTRFEENGYHYFLNIIDYKLKNTTSPLSFEKNNIKERIINIRIKDLRDQVKNEIISKAYNDGNVKIY
ncbi:MAG: hypothetical protein R2780_05100 [Crocinitomicaceae bacterium]|nr:hypothetical protein [Crocinitomicaceae bacterium]